MWEYNHTETMFNNSTELYHSDIYLGQDYSDGIRHYKYVKKIPIGNGKFRYIYDIKSTYNNANGRYEKIRGNNKSKYGEYARTNKDGSSDKYIVRKSNKLFSSKSGHSISLNGGPKNRTTVHEVGQLRQNYDYVSDKVNKKLKKLKKKLNKKKIATKKRKVTRYINGGIPS